MSDEDEPATSPSATVVARKGVFGENSPFTHVEKSMYNHQQSLRCCSKEILYFFTLALRTGQLSHLSTARRASDATSLVRSFLYIGSTGVPPSDYDETCASTHVRQRPAAPSRRPRPNPPFAFTRHHGGRWRCRWLVLVAHARAS